MKTRTASNTVAPFGLFLLVHIERRFVDAVARQDFALARMIWDYRNTPVNTFFLTDWIARAVIPILTLATSMGWFIRVDCSERTDKPSPFSREVIPS